MKKIKEKIKKIKTLINEKLIKKYCKTTLQITDTVEEAKNTKFDNRFIGKLASFCISGLTLMGLSTTTAFADSKKQSSIDANTSSLDNFIDFACSWLQKIGGAVMLVGGVMFALGWQREDAEGKTRGLQTLLAGGMVVAIGSAKGLFGL